jgi:hypothetical protein
MPCSKRNGGWRDCQGQRYSSSGAAICGIAYGINVVARVSPSRERLEDMAKAAIQTLG